MPDISLQQATGLHTWAKMMVNNQESWRIPSPRLAVDFYRDDDSAYLVINHYLNNEVGFEYVFLAEKEDEASKTAIFIFDLLKAVNYSLGELLIWLGNANFLDTEMGEAISVWQLTIWRKEIKND